MNFLKSIWPIFVNYLAVGFAITTSSVLFLISLAVYKNHVPPLMTGSCIVFNRDAKGYNPAGGKVAENDMVEGISVIRSSFLGLPITFIKSFEELRNEGYLNVPCEVLDVK